MYESASTDRIYLFNPEFVAKVHAKRREEKAAKQAEERRKRKNERERSYYARDRRLPEPREFNAHVVAYLRRKLAEECADDGYELNAEEPRRVTDIIREVAEKHDLRSRDLVGQRRSAHIIKARHEAMVRAYVERPDLSLPQIGNLFLRDHTSIMHAVKKAGVWRNPAKATT